MDVASGEDLPDDAVATNYWPWRVSWLADESGFAYVSGDTVRVHRLGEPVGEDPVVFRAKGSPLPHLAVRAAADGSLLFVTAFHPTDDTTRVYARAVEEEGDAAWTELFGEPEGSYQVIGKRGDRVFAYTTFGAPNGRILASDLGRPGPEHWVEVVPEHEHAIYDDNHPVRPTAALFADRIVLLYGTEGRLILRVHDLDGELVHEIVHQELGFTESGLIGHPDEPFVRYDVQSLLDPGSAHEVDLRTGEKRVIDRARTPFDPDLFTLYRRSYESDDGTRVPTFLAHRKDMDPEGAHAALINNWAGGGMVVRPLYLPELLAWIEAGGVLAVPAVRGSGEYGEEWHRAGTGPNKGTSIDDFGAVARWLVEEGIAGEGRVGLLGASMSGAATAGVLVRHADALAAALIQIPRVDLLAEPKWFEEYGDSTDPEEFAAMMEWMPLPNIEARAYPATLVQVGSTDAVAPPFHGYKLVAALQHAQTGSAPIHLQVIWGVGHNTGNGIPHQSETLGFQFAFLARSLGLGSE